MPAKSDIDGKPGAARRTLGLVLVCLFAAACGGASSEQDLVKATRDERSTDSVEEGPTKGAHARPRRDESAEEDSPVLIEEDDLDGIEAQPEAAHPFRSIRWLPGGEAIVTAGRRLSVWRGSRPARVTSARFRPHRFPAVGAGGIAVGCSEDVLCILDSDQLQIQNRLRCPADRVGPITVWGPAWSPDGRWVAAHCASGTSRHADSEVVKTCIWHARTGARVRCVDTRQLVYYTQPFGWREDEEGFAASIAGGIIFLEPPTFQSVPATDDPVHVQVAHPGDSHWRFDWSPVAPLLVAVTGDDGRIVELRETIEMRRFRIPGPVSDVVVAPNGDEVAVLYKETLDLYATADGQLLRRLNLSVSDGRLEWSSDGRYLAVEWRSGGHVGLTVYDSTTLQRLFGRRETGARTWLPVSWHPERPAIAYRRGSQVAIETITGTAHP